VTISLTVAGQPYPIPSSAADVDWAAQQVAFEQAVAVALSKGAAIQVLSTNATVVGNGADTTEDDLMSFILPGGTLATGQGVRVTGWGNGVSTSDVTTVRAYVGANDVFAAVLTASQFNHWRAVFELLNVDGSNINVGGEVVTSGAAFGSTSQLYAVEATAAISLGADQVIKFTGQRASTASANSVKQYGMIVEFIP